MDLQCEGEGWGDPRIEGCLCALSGWRKGGLTVTPPHSNQKGPGQRTSLTHCKALTGMAAVSSPFTVPDTNPVD